MEEDGDNGAKEFHQIHFYIVHSVVVFVAVSIGPDMKALFRFLAAVLL